MKSARQMHCLHMNRKARKTNSPRYRRFIRHLIDIVEQTATQEGNFQHAVVFNEQAVTYRFCFAEGMHLLFKQQKYASCFVQSSPAWVDLLHPQIVRELFDCAIRMKLPLPVHNPASVIRIGNQRVRLS